MLGVIYTALLFTASLLSFAKEDPNKDYCNMILNKNDNKIINYNQYEKLSPELFVFNSSNIYYNFFKEEIDNIKIKFFFYRKICIITESENCILIQDKGSIHYENYIFLDPKGINRCNNDYFFNYFCFIFIIFSLIYHIFGCSKILGFMFAILTIAISAFLNIHV